MKPNEAAVDINYDKLLGDVPRVESITANYGFIPESWFFFRRWSHERRRESKS